jgi:uncharacterized protein involved in outer membrane biogenesis
MKHGLKIVGIALASLIALLVLVLLLLANMDWNRAKPWISDKVSTATGRTFSIDGDLSLNWQWPAEEEGWHRFIPWPTLHAEKIMLGNAEWATIGPTMASIRQIDMLLNPLTLLGKTIRIESLTVMQPRLILETDKKDGNNWTFPIMQEESKGGSGWQLDLRNLTIKQGMVRYVDPVKQADITARVGTSGDGTMTWKLSGEFNDEKLSGNGKTGGLLALRDKGIRYPFEALVRVGETTITANGSLTNPAHPSAMDLELKILGASMADLFPISGLLLPETPKFSTEGRVIGTLKPGSIHLRYENFKGKVGSSDIGGTLEFLQKEPRPLLRGDVVSNRLNFKDLGAIVGAGDGKKKQKEGEIKQPPDKMLPVSPFKTERWDKIDVAVQFTGKEIIRGETLPLDNLHANVRMDNGLLSLAPLNFGIAGGKLTTELSIDGRSDPAKAKMKVTARQLKLKQMFPAIETMRSSLGQVQADAQLSAAGNSIAALMGSANGEVKSLITEGTVSKFILEAIGLNVGSVVMTQLFGDRQVDLNCMAADFGVTDGLMKARAFVIDTSDATIHVNGGINFNREVIDLGIYPESKGVRIISLRSPLYVKGTFKEPDVGIDKGTVALKAGAAVALGTLASPFAALLALINPGPDKKSPCAILLAKADEKPVAPPPGKSASPKARAKK